MKCKLTDKNAMKMLLAVSIALIALGAVAAYLLPEEMHLATRIAGFVSGIGSSLALVAGVMLVLRWRLGEARMKDSERMMNDERGLAVAYKAQSVAAIAAVFALIAVAIAALVRGDQFYMMLCSALLCAVALCKLVAWHVYNRKM